jgi:hypothetical protein
MIFLQLNSNMVNFTKMGSVLTWEIENLQFPNKDIALSSFVINFSRKVDIGYLQIATNLIQQNTYNPDGILYCSVFHNNRDRLSIAPPNYEFWKIDIKYPRLIKIQLDNINIDLVTFTSITLVIN